MIKLYKYLYYWLYSWNLKTWGEKDLPHWNALFGVSFMMFLNLAFLALFLQFLGVRIFLRDQLPKKELVLIMLGLFVVNYFIFIRKDNYRSFVKELEREPPEKRRLNTIVIWLYVILSFVLFVVSAICIGKLTE